MMQRTTVAFYAVGFVKKVIMHELHVTFEFKIYTYERLVLIFKAKLAWLG